MDNVKDLRIAIIISDETSPIIAMCLDSTLRFIRKDILRDCKIGNIIFFEDSSDDFVKFAIKISEFEYFTNVRCFNRDDYDEYLYKIKNGLCVPKQILAKHNVFIVNNGGGRQLIVYCQTNNMTYADWRYTDRERNLIELYFESANTFDIDANLNQIDTYLNSTNFIAVIESLEIFNDEVYISRPGKDDYYYIEKKRTSFKDLYIDSLFPTVAEEIYKDHGWCSYSDLRVDFVRRDYLEEESIAIENAKLAYNKDQHRRYLLHKLFKEFEDKQQRLLKKREQLLKDLLQEYFTLLQTQRVNIPFAKQLNNLLRSFYHGLHHGDIGSHNFATPITRD